MQYLAMIYGPEGRWEALSEDERTAVYARYTAFADDAREAGVLADGGELAATTTATTVRVRNGETLVTDGPFVESKEALGGYFLLECESHRSRRRLGGADPRRRDRRDRGSPLLRRRVRGGRGMKYALLLTNSQEDRERWDTMPEDEQVAARAAEVPKWNALFGELGASGKLLSGSELDDPDTSKTVRLREGERVVTDGPFAETKEQIGGLMVIEADDLDEAISIAARIPVAERASVEIRPLVG